MSVRNQIVFKDSMTTHEKILATIYGLNIDDNNNFQKGDLFFILEIVDENENNFVMIKTSTDLRKSLREFYDKDNYKYVDIRRIVNVKKGNSNWERSDFASEILTCLNDFKTEEYKNGKFDSIYCLDILELFDSKIKKEQIDHKYVFKNDTVFIEEQCDERLSPYIFECIGENCKNLTNGSQYCRKFFCETEEIAECEKSLKSEEASMSKDNEQRPTKKRRIGK